MTTEEQILHELTDAEREGLAPTAADLAAWIGLSPRAVHYAIVRLEQAGKLKVSNRKRRPCPLFLRVLKNIEIS